LLPLDQLAVARLDVAVRERHVDALHAVVEEMTSARIRDVRILRALGQAQIRDDRLNRGDGVLQLGGPAVLGAAERAAGLGGGEHRPVLERTRHPPAMPDDREVAELPDEIAVEIVDRRDADPFVARGKPLVRIGEIPRARRAVPHRNGQPVGNQLGRHVGRDIPRVEAGARHAEGGQAALRIVGRIDVHGDAPLMVVREAMRHLGAELGARQRWQQHAGQDGDDGDNHQQLDQRKGGR